MVDVARRDILKAAGLLAAAGATGTPALAKAPLASKQAPAIYRMKVGDYEVSVLADGARVFPMPDSFVTNVPKDKALAAAEAAYMPKGMVKVPFNPTLVNTGSKLILIDTGNGPAPDGKVGQLTANLAAAGIKPEDIDVILISHLHPDHINGLLNAEGKLAWPNAEIKAAGPDWAFWMSDDNMAKASTPLDKNYFANTRKILTGLKDRIERFEWGKEVAPGITSIAAPGHTPGHTAFAVASGSSKVFVQSDVTNIPEFFLRNPDWHVMFDHDADLAQKTRHAFYDMAAAEKADVIGYHFSFPSVGHVEKDGAGYRLVPASWSTNI